MNRKRWQFVGLFLAIALVAGCTTFNVKDPVAAGLYATKEEWVAVREHVIAENAYGRLSDADLESFRVKDRTFEASYKLAVALRGSGSPVFDSEMKTLRELLLEARRKYYPAGGVK